MRSPLIVQDAQRIVRQVDEEIEAIHAVVTVERDRTPRWALYEALDRRGLL